MPVTIVVADDDRITRELLAGMLRKHGFIVETQAELERALREAERMSDSFSILDVQLSPLDRSPALERLAARLAKRLL